MGTHSDHFYFHEAGSLKGILKEGDVLRNDSSFLQKEVLILIKDMAEAKRSAQDIILLTNQAAGSHFRILAALSNNTWVLIVLKRKPYLLISPLEPALKGISGE